jgi:hypothetical protein
MQIREFTRSRWYMPLFSLSLGAVMFVAFAIGDNVGQGLVSFGIMAALGALFLFGRRSETLDGLVGPGRDERWAMIDLRATALAGAVTTAFVIGAWLYEVSQGRDGNEFALIGAVGGLSYVIAVAVLRWRG